MIGPRTKKMPNKKICTGCDVLISKEMGGTKRFPKKWIVFYCNHKDLPFDWDVLFIRRNIPYTPKWCPALKQKNNKSIKTVQ